MDADTRLSEVQDTLATLPQPDRLQIEACRAELYALLARLGGHGLLALVLVANEFAAHDTPALA